jgi:DNA invertase Pin-like site-specific DNA recombinase
MRKMIRKVAIYARVSTEHEAQLSALENQIEYYDMLLENHNDWRLYKRYVDEGLSATSIKKRTNFIEMIKEAKEGYFDLIITREVSRFARNIVDTIRITRELKEYGVEVFFIEDNIWTLKDEDGELRLSILHLLLKTRVKKYLKE